MKKILASVGIAGSVFAGLMGSGIGIAHADEQSYLTCLHGSQVNSSGHDNNWWVALGHSIMTNIRNGGSADPILFQLIGDGMSTHDAAFTIRCATWSISGIDAPHVGR